jgi:hypothetical protein
MLNITREQFFEFIKKKKDTADNLTSATQHYLNYFDKYQNTGKKTNWNWSALFCSFVWMGYRRMYAYILLIIVGLSVGILALVLVLSLVLYLLSLLGAFIPEALGSVADMAGLVFGVVLIFIAYILPGLYADYMYLRYASKKISTGKKTSGVSIWAACIVLILLILISLGR